MQLNLKNPLAVFDLETTGTNIIQDRIVEISIVKTLPDGKVITKTSKINPEIPIPRAASLIHGIYDKDVKDAPTFKHIAKNFAQFLEGTDLGGFNVLRFDLPLLVEEFLRADVPFNLGNRKIVDAQRIFHMMEKRNLTAAYKFYCDKQLDDAHSAEADALATLEVIKGQIVRYEGNPVMDTMGKEIGKIENNMEALHQLTASKMVDLAGRIVFNDQNVEIFNFGKYRHQKVEEILQKDPSYYDWIMKNEFPLDTKRKLTEIKLRGFQHN